MAFEQQQRKAARLLAGIEDGTLNSTELRALAEEADPALLCLMVRWLRKRYADHVNADTVIGRLVELGNHRAIAARLKEGQTDPVVEWFEDAYAYRDVSAQQLIELVVDKLES